MLIQVPKVCFNVLFKLLFGPSIMSNQHRHERNNFRYDTYVVEVEDTPEAFGLSGLKGPSKTSGSVISILPALPSIVSICCSSPSTLPACQVIYGRGS